MWIISRNYKEYQWYPNARQLKIQLVMINLVECLAYVQEVEINSKYLQ